MAFGSNLVKPSELFGSVKRTINRSKQSRCQCKHHQQKLLARQEEQRQQLQEQLRLRGDRRKITSAPPEQQSAISRAFQLAGAHQKWRKCNLKLSSTQKRALV